MAIRFEYKQYTIPTFVNDRKQIHSNNFFIEIFYYFMDRFGRFGTKTYIFGSSSQTIMKILYFYSTVRNHRRHFRIN